MSEKQICQHAAEQYRKCKCSLHPDRTDCNGRGEWTEHAPMQYEYCHQCESYSPAPPTIAVQVAPEAFRFVTFDEWVNNAQGFFAAARLSGHSSICVDALGRVCKIGKHFMRARDEDSFPVVVYPVDKEGQ